MLLFIGQILTAAMVIITGVSLIMTVRLRKWSKTVETTNIYLKRFDDLQRDLQQAAHSDVPNSSIWRPFWYLQQEQYFLWRKGLIDKTFYEIWMDFRSKEWEENRILKGMSYRGSWEEAATWLAPEFKKFMEGIFSRQSQKLPRGEQMANDNFWLRRKFNERTLITGRLTIFLITSSILFLGFVNLINLGIRILVITVPVVGILCCLVLIGNSIAVKQRLDKLDNEVGGKAKGASKWVQGRVFGLYLSGFFLILWAISLVLAINGKLLSHFTPTS